MRQRSEGLALEVIAHMVQGRVVSLDSSLAVDAAQYGVELSLPLADSIIYAIAQKYNALVWAQDADIKLLEGVKYYSKSEKA